MKKLSHIFLLFCLLISASTASAQQIIKQFTVQDGLPSSEVYHAYQDSEGLFWFCTDRGISKFDGNEFVNYSVVDGLSHNTIFKVFEDPEHNLWFTAHDGTVTIYNRQSQSFTPFPANEELQMLLRHPADYNWIHVISFLNNNVYFVPRTNKYDGVIYFSQLNDLDNVSAIPADQFKKMTDQFKTFKLIKVMEYNKTGSAYNFCYSYAYRNDTSTLRPTQVDYFNSLTFKPYVNPYSALINDQLFVCTINGILTNSNDGKDSVVIPINDASSIMLDNENLYWVTSLTEGVFVIPANGIKTVEQINTTKTWGRLRSISKRNEQIYVSTTDDLFKLDPKTLSLNWTINPRPLSEIPYTYVINGHIIHREIDERSTIDKLYHKTPLAVNTDDVIKFWDENIDLRALNAFHGRKTSFFAHVTQKNELLISSIDGLFKIYTHDQVENLSEIYEINTQVKHIIEIDDLLLFSTLGQGLQILGNETMDSLKVEDGLVSNLINTMYLDSANNALWLGTNKGVSVLKYHISDGKFILTGLRNITYSEGLLSDYILGFSMLNEQMFCLSPTGISNLDALLRYKMDNAPVVNRLELSFADSVYYDGGAVLPFGNNSLNFKFLAVYNKKTNDVYRYRLLNGYDTTEWQYSSSGEVSFNNLNPGNYVFAVAARGKNSSWGIQKLFEFEISPKWYMIWWVKTLGVITFLLIALVTVLYNTRKIRLRNESQLELEQLKLENTKLELSALRYNPVQLI